jgi:hypothetical protein
MNNDDESLRDRLRDWDVDPPVPPRFQANVWTRIREREVAREATGWAAFLRWLFPSRIAWQLAAVTAAIMIAAGAGLGTTTAASANARTRIAFAERYARSIDPYLQLTINSAK